MTTLDFEFKNNQYAVLSDAPEKALPSPARHRMMYRVDVGNDRVCTELTPAQGNEWATTSTTFYGKCHNCNYSAHSQKQCPLSKCAFCGAFGHAVSICPSR